MSHRNPQTQSETNSAPATEAELRANAEAIVQAAKSAAPKPTSGDAEATTAKFFDDLEKLRLSPEDTGGLGSKKVLTTVPVRRPGKQEFFRCHPDEAMTLTAMLFVDSADGEAYFVAPAMRDCDVLANQVKPTLLQLTVLRSGVLIIWPLTLPNSEKGSGGGKSWHESALKARVIGKTKWTRVVADKAINGYQTYVAEGKLDGPDWVKLLDGKTFNELLEIAFADKIILDEEHPVVRSLRGLL
jgi:hypothetical protein